MILSTPSREATAWSSFIRRRRVRFYTESAFSKAIEGTSDSMELSLFGTERRLTEGLILNPAHYKPDEIQPPISLDAEEFDLLQQARVRVLWE